MYKVLNEIRCHACMTIIFCHFKERKNVNENDQIRKRNEREMVEKKRN